MIKIEIINPHVENLIPEKSFRKFRSLISVPEVIKYLRNQCNVWIFDLRSRESYFKNHIVNSKHVNCTTNLMAKMSIMNLKTQFNTTDNLPDKIIMYNQSDSVYNNFLLQFIDKLDRKFDARFLEGGFEKFTELAPKQFLERSQNKITCSPTNQDVVSDDIMLARISEIEPDLLLGNEVDSANLDLLNSMGITHILCVTANTKLHFEDLGLFEYKRIEASDSSSQNLLQYFDESYQFIENAKRNNGKVLVHCVAGVSRSVTIAMAFLIKKYKIKVLKALDIVKEKRPIASPNLNFLGQLERYYKLLDIHSNK